MIALQERRIKVAYVPEEMIPQLLARVPGQAFLCTGSDIPEGSDIQNVTYDPRNARFVVTIGNPAFDEVPIHEAVPVLKGTRYKIVEAKPTEGESQSPDTPDEGENAPKLVV